MTNINKKQLGLVYTVISSKTQLNFLRNFNHKNSFTFLEISTKMALNSSHTSYFLRRLEKAKLIKKDEKRWFLTRIGLDTIKILKRFEKVCTEYDLSDCDADGKINFVIQRNRLYNKRGIKSLD